MRAFRVKSRGLAFGIASIFFAAPLPLLAEPVSIARQITFGSGQFVIEFNREIDRYRLVPASFGERCDPGLAIKERGDDLEIVQENKQCKTDVYATLQINPDWTDHLLFLLDAGQLDLGSSVLMTASEIEARVKFGDIVGHTGVERAWLFGAKLSANTDHPGVAIQARVGAGQISFLQR